MPISSLHADVEVPPVDLWSLYMDLPKPYPDDHRKPPTFKAPRSQLLHCKAAT